MKWIITASERQRVVAVTVFKHVLMSVFLCGFSGFFCFFCNNFPPEHYIKRTRYFSAFTSAIPVLWGTVLLASCLGALALTDWFTARRSVWAAHPPVLLRGGVSASFIVTTNLPLLSGIIPSIQATRFCGFLKRDSDCPWLMSEMFNQQDCKDGPTNNFMWAAPQMTMCNKKKKRFSQSDKPRE